MLLVLYLEPISRLGGILLVLYLEPISRLGGLLLVLYLEPVSRLGGVELGGIILTLMISLSQAYMFTPPDKKSLNCEDFCVSTGFQV